MAHTHPRKIAFLTGTRADFGKLKPLMLALNGRPEFEVHIFATGMHLSKKHGDTVIEIEKSGFEHIHRFDNAAEDGDIAETLSRTVSGFSAYIRSLKPDLIVVHGDRIEPLAGALVGSLDNIPVAHVEGGEVSGTIDEHLRHAISKLSHLHFVANERAKRRLIQMGENSDTIFVIGSPDLDVLLSSELPTLDEVRKYYEIPFAEYGVVGFHSVTTDRQNAAAQANTLVDALIASGRNYVVIYPNNDAGSEDILATYEERISNDSHFRVIRSMRFEYFLTLLKHAVCVVGNSSAGIREAPFYGVPSIDLGSRQDGRLEGRDVPSVTNLGFEASQIQKTLDELFTTRAHFQPVHQFGNGDSTELFLGILLEPNFWDIRIQKKFVDIG